MKIYYFNISVEGIDVANLVRIWTCEFQKHFVHYCHLLPVIWKMSDVQSLLTVKIKNYNSAKLLKFVINLQSCLKDSILKHCEPNDPETDSV